MKSLRAAAIVAAASVLLSLTVAAPSAVADQGCQSIPTFCAWEEPFFQGDVRNLTDPPPNCQNLGGPRRSFVNDTGYEVIVFSQPNCPLLSLVATALPRGFMNETVPINSVLFVAI